MAARTPRAKGVDEPRVRVEAGELSELCRAAVLRHGGSPAMAASLADAIVHAELRGKSSVGVGHLFDYLDSLVEGRIDGGAQSVATWPTPSLALSDARDSIPHLAFDGVFEELVQSARANGVCVLSVRNAYTCGEVGYFVDRLARSGLVALAVANATALMSVGGSKRPVLGTNPLAFAVPGEDGPALLVDQASSHTAFVSIRQAAEAGAPIPRDWALDGEGEPTSDAREALAGALLPFGGYKGGNIALMVELLSALSGASWSVDSGPFDSGSRSPAVGMFVLCLDPARFDPAYVSRVSEHLDRLETEHGARLPGRGKAEAARARGCEIPADILAKLRKLAA
ncbi:Ldh family oxidoreductase [Sinomonas mesophila]|uniref:Ldh family oxidoreductase n=1 Tax=Sinomonas mesophila TaxID=1531955 RepID=UPI001C37A200|nr:Ldh family oxidoreductase [Sinomonas mesophila]